MKEKIFKKGLSKRILSLVVALAMMITLMPGVSMTVKAATKEVSNVSALLDAMNNAQDGDIVKLTRDITWNKSDGTFRIPTGRMVTLDLNGKYLHSPDGDSIGVGANSALLIKNGTMYWIDTNNADTGILILSNVKATKFWLGKTITWIVNNSNIELVGFENGQINPGATDLHPDRAQSQWDERPYAYTNSAPAIVGAGTNWTCKPTLQQDFTQAEQTGYHNIILLKDETLSENSTLTAADIHFNLGGYTLTTNGKTLSMANSSGTNTIKNGTINGNITMGSGAGNVLISGVDMTGTISNVAHPTTIENGHYGSIAGGTGKITINNSNAFFAGNLTGNSYEITAGYFVNKPNENYIPLAYDIVPETKTEKGVIYKYTVKPNTHDWKYSTTENADEKKLVATCKNNSKHKYELTITVEDQDYSRTATEPTIIYGTDDERSEWEAAGLVLPDSTGSGKPTITKKYYNTDENGVKIVPNLDTVPTTVGRYYVDAEISYGTDSDKKATVSLPYNINKRSTADTSATVKGGKRKITIENMDPDQEYIVTTEPLSSPLNEEDWENGIKVVRDPEGSPEGVVEGLDDGTMYYVYTRTKDTSNTEKGDPALIHPPTKTDFGQPNNNKTGYTVDEDGKIHIESGYEVFEDEECTEDKKVNSGTTLEPGKKYYVRKKAEQVPGGGGAGAGIPIQFEYRPQNAPVADDFNVKPPQCDEGYDGKITGLDPSVEYQYQIDGEDIWRDVPKGSTEIAGLSAGNVKLRVKGDDPNNASPSTDITIPNGNLPKELKDVKTEPDTSDGGSSYKLTGVNDTMQYSTDGGNTWIDVPAPNPGDTDSVILGIPVGTVVQVRLKDAGSGTPSGSLILEAGTKPSHTDDGSGHVHNFEWGNWNPVSKDENGTKVYQCTTCGYVLEKEYIPAYAYTCLTESEHVLKTPQNGSVICDMGRWNAYPRWFFEKLATRPDVNITLKFLYQHKQYTVYIPAGTKIDTEHDWYGPLKICSLYKYEVK